MLSDMIGVQEAASELRVGASRVRELLAQGALPGEKLGGRWLLRRADVLARRRKPVPPGRPLSTGNAWLLLLEASGERPPGPVDAVARWRMRRALVYPGLAAMRPRLQHRAQAHHLWALPAELRALRDARDMVLTGSSATGGLGLELVAPDALDAYVPAQRLRALVAEHALQEVDAAQANVTLRAVPREAWLLDGRELAPAAAVALDLAGYPDSRSARVGEGLLRQLDREGRRR
ncbi:MAG TPA: helix-turn-helix domain-containing protein [Solirubrobacteraceae bacterium]|jgi:excisionase family DNA binding protein